MDFSLWHVGTRWLCSAINSEYKAYYLFRIANHVMMNFHGSCLVGHLCIYALEGSWIIDLYHGWEYLQQAVALLAAAALEYSGSTNIHYDNVPSRDYDNGMHSFIFCIIFLILPIM